MANSPTELITQFVDSLVDLVATRVQEKHGEALKVYVDLYLHNAVDKRISAKLSD
jgi:hypothetical protein